MKAVILAAGRGTRLRALHDRPKCLLEIGGVALFDRYITTLDALGVETTVVAGYRAEDLHERLATLAPRTACRITVNDDFERGSILSLACGLAVVEGDVLLLDGDVLFHPDMLRRLVASESENSLLVDVGSAFTGEEYMTGLDDHRVNALARARVDGHEATGEWVGFARLGAAAVARLREAIHAQIAAGHTAGGYEDALALSLPEIVMRYQDVSDLPWVEIDFPADVERAELFVRTGQI